jgi:D-beta-D-heptose 7-phosphate kinase/D-beta-D-heptose 1-phosphate adenosyltransferase
VTLFDEDTPRELIERLLPDILVKGGDYAIEDIVGREAVEGAGGAVMVVPFVGDYSTSALLQRLRESL